MNVNNSRFGPYFGWSVAIAAAIFVFLIVFPFFVRLTLPPDGPESSVSPAAGAGVAAPLTFSGLVDRAQARLATLPAGVTERADLAQKLNEKSIAGRPITVRKELEQVARLHAFDMLEYRFHSGVDQNGLLAGDRVAMLDRTGLYAGLDEQLAVVRPSGDAAADFAAVMGRLDTPNAVHVMQMRTYNSIGIGCAERSPELMCVRLIGALAGEISPAAPIAIAPGASFELQPKSVVAAATYVGWKWVDSVGNELPALAASQLRRVQAPPDYRGVLRLRISFGGTSQLTDLDGPSIGVQ